MFTSCSACCALSSTDTHSMGYSVGTGTTRNEHLNMVISCMHDQWHYLFPDTETLHANITVYNLSGTHITTVTLEPRICDTEICGL